MLARFLPRFAAAGELGLGFVKYSMLALLLFVARSHAQVSILGSTTSATETSGSSTTKTMSFTVPAGNNRLLVVTTGGGGNDVTALTVTYNGAALTQAVVSTPNPYIRSSIWYRVMGSNASSTAANVVVTYDKNYFFNVTATAFQGVDQSTPVSGATSANSPSLSVASAAGDIVIDAIAGEGTAANVAAGAGQTLQAKNTDLVATHAAASTAEGGASVTMNWAGYTANIAHVGANLRHAFVAAPTVTGVSPTSGAPAGGTSVVITGTDFTSVTAVKFGTTAATSYTVNSATQITATSPALAASTVDITVATAFGTSSSGASDQFTYVPAPTVTSVTVPANATYAIGADLEFTVNFSAAVTVTGSPRLSIDIGGVTRYATYVSGSGTTALLFRYTLQSGDNDSDGIAVISPLDPHGDSINATAGDTPAVLTLNGLASTAAVRVNAATSPGAPTAVIAVAGHHQAVVSFTAPVSNGGAAITSYTVTASPGGATVTGASSPLTVTGLTDGTSYTFTVTATNSVDTGAASSASAAATPSGDWAHNYSASGYEAECFAVATDAAGNVYAASAFSSATLTLAGTTLTRIGNSDTVVAKFNPTGILVWAKNFGGVGADTSGQSLAVDSAGNVYLGGYYAGANLTTPALAKIGNQDAFVLKLDAAGDTVWAKNFGGAGAVTPGYGVAVDSASNVYLGGNFSGANLTTPALAKIGNQDVFALKLDAAGDAVWAKNFGGAGALVYGNGVAADGAGNFYLGGNFSGANLTAPALAKIGTMDAFALKLDAAGNAVWAKNFGGAGVTAFGNGIAVDGASNVYLAGNFSGANLTTPVAAALTKIGAYDVFALKLDATGATTWARNFGGPSLMAYGYSVAVNGAGVVCLGGDFGNGNLTTPVAAALTKIGSHNAFALKLDSTGATTWAKNFGGAGATSGGDSVALDDAGNVYLGGYFYDANLTTPALTKIGERDALLIKCAYPIDTNTPPVIANLNGDSVGFTEGGSAVLLDAGGNATATDANNPSDFNGGNLTVAITGATANEDISISTAGTVTLGTGMNATSVVSVGGTSIGTIAPGGTGQNGSNLVVSFTSANATPARVATLLQAITYAHDSDAPPASRTVAFTVKDGDGGTSTAANVTVNITSVNDTPTDLALSSLTINQSAGANGVVGTLSATDADDTTFTFTLVAGNGTNDAANASFNLSGTSLRANNATALAPGTYAVRVQADDGKAAGTYAKSFTLTVVDNVAPAAPSTPNLDSASDSGTSASDNLTTDTTPTFSGTAEAGSTVKLYQDVNEVGSAIATDGNWTITSIARPAGSHAFTAKATDAAGNVSPASGSLGVIIDTDAPTVSSVGVPANGTYFAGQNLDFTVNWTEVMAVSTTFGTPSITVTVGGTPRQATYLSGSGTAALVFRCTMQSGDLDSDGVTVGVLALNSGVITDRAGNPATLTLNSVGSTAAVVVDAVAPTVSGRTVPANGTYKLGAPLDFALTYSEAVTVTGTPAIGVTLATGGTVNATYASGSGTTTLTFRYTVASGHLDADGIAVAAAITLSGGTIKDATSNDAQTTTLGFGDTAGVLVDGVAPTVTSSNRQTPAGTMTKATSVTYRVTFSEPVTGVDSADFALTKTATANGTIASVSPVTGSETTVYDVVVNSVSGNGTLRLDLKNAGTGIADLATNAIATGYTAGQTYTIDNTAPTLSAVARQPAATLHTDAPSATWRVTFSEGVTGVDAADFVLTAPAGSGSTATGVIASVTGVAGNETMIYDVVVNVSGQGQARLDLKASGTGIADLAGNALADGGFITGSFYLVGITNVFDTVGLLPGTTRVVQGSTSEKVAQRFTTGATAPLSLTTVAAHLGFIVGTPLPKVSVYTDNADPVGGTLVATLTNPASLSASALNLWTSTQLLSANTTYWLVFEDASAAGSYEIAFSGVTSGGVGAWLTTYAYAHGVDFATNPQPGSLRIAIGATGLPTITSALTASGTYGTAFAGYTITATDAPTSFTATGLPSGLSLATGTGVISGAPTQAGSFNVSLTATNGSGTGSVSTLVLTIAKAPLTVTANDTQRYVGYANPSFSVSYAGFRNGDTAAGLTTAPTATTTATNASPEGTYPITPAGGVSANYTFSYVAGTLTVAEAPPPSKTAQTITFASLADATLGQTVSLSATADSGLPVAFSIVGGPATLSGSTLTTTGLGLVTVRASQAGNGSYEAATPVARSFQVTVGAPPVVGTPTQVPAPTPGGAATLTVPQTNPNLTYQWQRNGEQVTGATGPALALNNMQPPAAGLYTYTATTAAGTGGTSDPVIVGVATTEKVVGTGELVGANILHPNGATYDQLLLEGRGASFTADAGQTTRMSFVDLSGDIVQVEFSGAGSLSLVMDDASAPSPAANYNQAGVNYVRGHPGLVITGANETSNVSVISVGRRNTINQSIFRDDVTYDGVANIAFIAIQSTNGKFGGVRTGNVEYFASRGFTGVYAPGVTFTGPLYVGNIQAYDHAKPVLQVGSVSDARIAGGNLAQPNRAPVCVCGLTRLTFVDGRTSQGDTLPAQKNQAVLEQDGVDVTDLIVPSP